MEETFEIYEFKYRCKRTRLKFVVYARTEKTANEIINIVNQDNIIYFEKPKFRRFKKPCRCTMSPYEIEQEQFEVAEQQHQKRLEYFKKHRREKE